MASRPSYGPSTTPPLPGVDFLTEYHAGMKGLFDAAAFPLTSVAGTADDVTATLAWDLDGGALVDGMKFTLTWDDDNTGPMTLALNGGSPADVLDASGGAMIAGAAEAGTRALLEYIGGAFRVLSGGGEASGATKYYWAFTSSGTWNKPAGLADDAMVIVEAWGAGGSGGRNNTAGPGGGGGGGYARAMFRAADLPSSVAIGIGAGGAARSNNGVGSTGGNTTFGALLTAYGGGGGGRNGNGGGGGGELAAGATDGAGGAIGGGTATGDATTIYGGGAGGGLSGSATAAGRAVCGGGGGGAAGNPAAGGVSVYAGNGGNGGASSGADGVAGTAPGGGGGASINGTTGAGARGEVRIWIP